MCKEGPELDPIEALRVAAERLAAWSRAVDRDGEQLAEDLQRKSRILDTLRLDFACDAAAFAETDEHERRGDTSPVAFLTNHCHMNVGAARSAMFLGEKVGDLPSTVAAMREGRIGYDHAVLMSRTVEFLASSGSDARLDEDRLLLQAVRKSPYQFRRDCEHARHAADQAAYLTDHRDAVEARFLQIRQSGGTGSFWIKGCLDPVAGATVRAALEPLAERTGPDDHRKVDRRMADALYEVSEYTLRTASCTEAALLRVPQLQVTTTLETLLGAPDAPGGELNGTVVPAATVQRLACSATVRRILLGPDSLPVDVGRARRVPATGTRLRVQARDGGCVWPRCNRPVRWSQLHHVAHWTRDDGPTEEPNLCSLCSRHHWMVHEGGWNVVRVAGQREVVTIPPVPLGGPAIRGPVGVPVSVENGRIPDPGDRPGAASQACRGWPPLVTM